MNNLNTNRLIVTPSAFARDNMLFVQEIGTLTSRSPHISARENIYSFLFMIVIKGEGTFKYMGQTSHLSEGDCVFINCQNNYSHESSADNPWTLNWVHFYGNTMSSMYDYYMETGGNYLFHPSSNTNILNILSSLYTVVERKDAIWETMSHKYLTDLTTALFINKNEPQLSSYTLNEKLKDIRNYIYDHCEEKLSLDILAEKFYISKYYLAREYKHRYGITIISDINSLRISKAKSLLRFSSETIENISIICGFREANYFIKIFKASEGITPLAYRKKW